MKKLAIILVLFMGLGYVGYSWATDTVFEANKKRCMESAQKNSLFRGDTTQLCSCTMEFSRNQIFFDKTNPEFKKEFGIRMMACAKVHVKQYGTNQCDNIQKEVKSKTGQNVDCSCVNQKMINLIIKQISETGEFEVPDSFGKMAALNLVSGCLE